MGGEFPLFRHPILTTGGWRKKGQGLACLPEIMSGVTIVRQGEAINYGSKP